MNKFSKALGAGILTLGVASPAFAAESLVFSWSGCGGSSFSSCATVDAYYDPTTRYLRFIVTNDETGSWPGVFTQLGWDGFNVDFDGSTFEHVSGSGSWTYDETLNSINDYSGADADSPPPTNGLHAGETAEFKIKFEDGDDVDFSDFAFALHEQGLEDYWAELGVECDGSNKLAVENDDGEYIVGKPANNGLVEETTPPEDCHNGGGGGGNVVPEPMTSALLATGLVALAGAGALKRRRNRK